MIVNSKFSSLYLGRKENWKAPFDQDVCYIQKFAIEEEIRIQFIGFTAGFTAKYIDENGITIPVEVKLIYADSHYIRGKLYEIVFSVENAGNYNFVLSSMGIELNSPFCILPIEELSNTILINYTHRRNEYDTIFFDMDGVRKMFNFRVEGGFYPGDKVQAIENEIFRDQRFEPYQTAAESYEISVLTIGTKKGVPQWVGNKINNIFKLSNILVDGVETTRNDSSVPELISQSSYYPLYVFKLNVEQPDIDSDIYTSEPFVLGTEDGVIIVTEDNKHAIKIY